MKPFLNGEILFSLTSPDAEKSLKEELFGCFKYVGIPFEVLDKMPVRDRRLYISLHNIHVQKENERMNGNSTRSSDIDAFTDMEQANRRNISSHTQKT